VLSLLLRFTQMHSITRPIYYFSHAHYSGAGPIIAHLTAIKHNRVNPWGRHWFTCLHTRWKSNFSIVL